MKTLEKTKSRNTNKKRKSKYKRYLEETWNGVPATVKPIMFELTLRESLSKSLIWHIVSILLIWLLVLTLNFFGITKKILPLEKMKTRNIEFILPSGRSGQKAASNQQTQINNIAEVQPDSQNSAKPTSNTSTKTVKNSSVSDFDIPMPSLKSMSSGLTNSNSNNNHAEESGSSSSLLNVGDSNTTEGNASSNGTGFNKSATRNMITPYDISPYVNELKRNIQWNWKASKNHNKNVELFLRIAKDGRLIILNVKKTSEIGEVDDAALNAVKKSLPLNPLPSKYNKSYLDVVFTFNANTISSRY